MSIFFGSDKAEALNLGSNLVYEVWVGDQLIFPQAEELRYAYGHIVDRNVGYKTASIPWWARTVHMFALGAGGGGAGGDGAVVRWGMPGKPGAVKHAALTREPKEGDEIKMQFHPPGLGAEPNKTGFRGGSTIIEYPGGILTAEGGAGGTGFSITESSPEPPGTLSAEGTDYVFGYNVASAVGYPNAGFGGGGGRGGIFGAAQSGKDGRAGAAALVFLP